MTPESSSDVLASVSSNSVASGITACFRVQYRGFSLDVDLQLPGRGVTALFGPSGSGKTTCLRVIAGLARGATGHISINGEAWLDTANKVSIPTHKRPLGYVFQEASLFAHLSVLENLQYGMARIAADKRRVELDQAADMLGIDRLLDRMPAGLSGGERQRVGIARALLTSPSLLLMDEPLAALDLKRKHEILPYLERLHDQLDIPVLYVTHSPDEVARLADHLVILDNGKVTASGPIAETLSRLDLLPAMADTASAVVDGRVGGYDENYRLLSIHLPNSASFFRVVHERLGLGQSIRIVVKARDVSLALTRQQHASILNVIAVRVVDVVHTPDSGHVLVRLDADGTPLLARITRYSRDQLALAPGMEIWAQIKAVSLFS
jgi:molybdate transport system ATP-binding protein